MLHVRAARTGLLRAVRTRGAGQLVRHGTHAVRVAASGVPYVPLSWHHRWGATSASVSDTYIDHFTNAVLYAALGPAYEVLSIFVERGEDLDRVQPAPLLAGLSGEHKAGCQAFLAGFPIGPPQQFPLAARLVLAPQPGQQRRGLKHVARAGSLREAEASRTVSR